MKTKDLNVKEHTLLA